MSCSSLSAVPSTQLGAHGGGHISCSSRCLLCPAPGWGLVERTHVLLMSVSAVPGTLCDLGLITGEFSYLKSGESGSRLGREGSPGRSRQGVQILF